MEIRSEPLSLGDLFEGLINVLKPLTRAEAAARSSPTVAPDVPIIHTDPGKLQQVLYNFLSNAIKFSPHGGRIDLVAERDGADARRASPSPTAARASTPEKQRGHLREVPPDRRLRHPHAQRHGPGPGDLARAGPPAGRLDRRAERPGRRRDVLDHRPPAHPARRNGSPAAAGDELTLFSPTQLNLSSALPH